ncbi:MAG: hypothetical protein WKF54_12540 [Nocardioidaceae bacterium]
MITGDLAAGVAFTGSLALVAGACAGGQDQDVLDPLARSGRRQHGTQPAAARRRRPRGVGIGQGA